MKDRLTEGSKKEKAKENSVLKMIRGETIQKDREKEIREREREI